MSIPGCPIGPSRLLALGGGGPKERLAAGGPLLFQLRVGLQAFEVFVQEPGEVVDGHAGLEDREDGLAEAFCLAVKQVLLAFLFFQKFRFALLTQFVAGLDLSGIIDRSFWHNILLSGGRRMLTGQEASGEEYFANGRKKFLVPIRILPWLAAGAVKGLFRWPAATVSLLPSSRRRYRLFGCRRTGPIAWRP
jgi:hypothetical protein